MSKYGPGVGILTVQRIETEAVKETLDRYNMKAEDRETILGALQQAFYEWSHANAFGCYVENAMIEQMGVEEYVKFIRKSMIEMATFIMKKLDETYYDPEVDEIQENLK